MNLLNLEPLIQIQGPTSLLQGSEIAFRTSMTFFKYGRVTFWCVTYLTLWSTLAASVLQRAQCFA